MKIIIAGTNPSCFNQRRSDFGCTSSLVYYYDTTIRQCQSFLYSGCDKSFYFTTYTACLSACGKGILKYLKFINYVGTIQIKLSLFIHLLSFQKLPFKVVF